MKTQKSAQARLEEKANKILSQEPSFSDGVKVDLTSQRNEYRRSFRRKNIILARPEEVLDATILPERRANSEEAIIMAQENQYFREKLSAVFTAVRGNAVAYNLLAIVYIEGIPYRDDKMLAERLNVEIKNIRLAKKTLRYQAKKLGPLEP